MFHQTWDILQKKIEPFPFEILENEQTIIKLEVKIKVSFPVKSLFLAFPWLYSLARFSELALAYDFVVS